MMYTTGTAVYSTGGNFMGNLQNPKEDVLNQIGLTKNESKVYIAMTELGMTTITKIAEKSKVHRVNVYDAVKKLKKKGLTNTITKDDKKFYQSTDPSILMTLLKEKELALQTLIPQLKLNQDLAETSDVRMFEGAPAIRNLLNNFLEKGHDRMTIGVPCRSTEVIGEIWLDAYHQRRIKKGIHLRHLYNKDAATRAGKLAKLPLTEVKIMSEKFNSPCSTSICGDEVVFALYPDNPAEKPIAILIKNQLIATAYKNYYEVLWNMAEAYKQ